MTYTFLYQGTRGAFGHMAALEAQAHISGSEVVEGLATFEDVWSEIVSKRLGILPVQNSYAGPVYTNLRGFIDFPVKIVGEILLPVQHCLLGVADSVDAITDVYSHPQALAQCREFIVQRGLASHEFSNTAQAAQMVSTKNKPERAAIASAQAAHEYDLNILAKDIQTQPNNTTRFFVVAHKDDDIAYTCKTHKTSVLFETHNKPATLYNCLGVFAQHNINILSLLSLPSKKGMFSYYFWADIEGTLRDPMIHDALTRLEQCAYMVRVAGEY